MKINNKIGIFLILNNLLYFIFIKILIYFHRISNQIFTIHIILYSKQIYF